MIRLERHICWQLSGSGCPTILLCADCIDPVSERYVQGSQSLVCGDCLPRGYMIHLSEAECSIIWNVCQFRQLSISDQSVLSDVHHVFRYWALSIQVWLCTQQSQGSPCLFNESFTPALRGSLREKKRLSDAGINELSPGSYLLHGHRTISISTGWRWAVGSGWVAVGG